MCDKACTYCRNENLLHVIHTGVCRVHSNVYGLCDIHYIRYLTTVDSTHSTSPAMHMYYHLTSGSEEVPLCASCTISMERRNSSSIREEPVLQDRPNFTSIITMAANSLVSQAEQGSITIFTNVLQRHKTVVLVCCTSEPEPDTLSCTQKEEKPL